MTQERIEELEGLVNDQKAQLKTSADALTAAQTEAGSLKSQVTEKDTEIAALNKRLEAQSTDIEAKNAELTKLRAEHEEARKAAVTAEVHALVGKKFYPTEEADQVALKLANPALFEKLLSTRPDLALSEQVVTDDKSTTPPAGSGEAPFTAAVKAATESK